MGASVQNIPVDGNFGGVESGPVRFCDDGPGLFINGADCFELRMVLRYLREGLEGKHRIDGMRAMLADIERVLAEGVPGNSNGGVHGGAT